MNRAQDVASNRIQLLTGREGEPTAIRNIGGNIVYLDDVTDVNTASFPLYPGDVATWQTGKPCYAISPSGSTVVLSDSLANTLGLGNVSATISGTVQTNAPSATDIAGAIVADPPAVGVTGTPPVQVANTPTVVQQGATTGTTPPAGVPTAASRQVSASSTATASIDGVSSGGGSDATLIAAPGAGSLELHGGVVSVSLQAASTSGTTVVTLTVSLATGVGGAGAIWTQVIKNAIAAGTSPSPTNVSIPIDFQGATLAALAGLKLHAVTAVSSGTGSVLASSVSASLNYATVQ